MFNEISYLLGGDGADDDGGGDDDGDPSAAHWEGMIGSGVGMGVGAGDDEVDTSSPGYIVPLLVSFRSIRAGPCRRYTCLVANGCGSVCLQLRLCSTCTDLFAVQ